MAKHKNTEILSILEEARVAASEQTDPNFKSAALIEVAKAYDQLLGANNGFIVVDNEEAS